MIVVPSGDGQRVAGILHQDIRNVHGGFFLADDDCSAVIHRRGDEFVSVGIKTPDRYEQIAGFHLAGIIADFPDIHAGICGGFQYMNVA